MPTFQAPRHAMRIVKGRWVQRWRAHPPSDGLGCSRVSNPARPGAPGTLGFVGSGVRRATRPSVYDKQKLTTLSLCYRNYCEERMPKKIFVTVSGGVAYAAEESIPS